MVTICRHALKRNVVENEGEWEVLEVGCPSRDFRTQRREQRRRGSEGMKRRDESKMEQRRRRLYSRTKCKQTKQLVRSCDEEPAVN